VEKRMKEFYDTLNERDRRHYAAVEAFRLGHGGIEYIAEVLGCDPKTVRHGRQDMETPPTVPVQRVRKKGRPKES
jgi:hypothetical protein